MLSSIMDNSVAERIKINSEMKTKAESQTDYEQPELY